MFNKLDQDNLRINLAECHFARNQIEWLIHPVTQSGKTPLSNKSAALQQLIYPTNIKKLRSFIGFVHHVAKIIPNLSQFCHSLRTLLKKNTKFMWTDKNEQHFNIVQEKIAELSQNKSFNPDLETRIKCDASRKRLGCEHHYSINELELLGVV